MRICIITVVVLLLGWVPCSSADTFVAENALDGALFADNDTEGTNVTWWGGATEQVGRTTPHYSVIYVFTMPNLAGQAIDSVDFQFDVLAYANDHPDPIYHTDIDVYAVRTSSASNTVLATDHFAGGGDAGVDNNGTFIQDDIALHGETGTFNTAESANIALTDWLVAEDPSAGDAIFLRLTPDNGDIQAESRNFTVVMADNSNTTLRPVLTIIASNPEVSTNELTEVAAAAFNSEEFTSYNLEYIEPPVETNWTATGATIAGTGDTLQMYDPAAAVSEFRQYRVKKVP